MNVEACKITHNGKAGKVFLILQINPVSGCLFDLKSQY